MKGLIHIGLLVASSAVACLFGWSADVSPGSADLNVSVPSVKVRPISLKLLDCSPLDVAKLRVELFMSCGGVFEYREPLPLGLIELFGSVDSFRRMLSCDSVEIVELKPRAQNRVPAPEHVDRKVRLARADTVALREVLCSDASFDWLNTRQPELRASFRIKFDNGGHVISLDLFLPENFVRMVTSQDASGSVSLKFGYPIVVEIIERYFPGALPKG